MFLRGYKKTALANFVLSGIAIVRRRRCAFIARWAVPAGTCIPAESIARPSVEPVGLPVAVQQLIVRMYLSGASWRLLACGNYVDIGFGPEGIARLASEESRTASLFD